MREIERERVFLVSSLPDLSGLEPVIIKVGDFYRSNCIDALKLKQKGEAFFLVKKEGDSVHERIEHQIPIKKGEFDVLWDATIQRHSKLRYIYPLGRNVVEIDLYTGALDGYVRAEIEFRSQEELESFVPPAWFGPEITGFNHDIHEDLGIVGFKEMEKRFFDKDIELPFISFPKNI